MPNKQSKNKRTIEGVISVTGKGTGFVAHPDFEVDILIEVRSLNTALNKDVVQVTLLPLVTGERIKGEVNKVIKRAKTSFVGTLEKEHGLLFLVPDDKRMYIDILVTNTKGQKIEKNTKALVKITSWKDAKRDPEGEIVKILGRVGEHEVEMEAIVLERGFEFGFPKDVEKEAEKIARTISEEEIKKRRDFRKTTTFTIDPHDAKDFDDALSLRELEDGTFEVGIHIADVSYYVRPGSAINKEAEERGTSIYLVDRTIPMLPEVLSNDVCSLRPNEDKLAYSAVFIIDSDARVKSEWFGETIIHSNKRFTYKSAQEVLEQKAGEYSKELMILDKLSKKLRKSRFENGSIAFSQDEVAFKLDEKGKPLEVFKKKLLDTNLLIEDFMLLANRRVASYFHTLCEKSNLHDALFVYRIHDTPKVDKIEELGIFLRAVGYDFETSGGEVSAKAINKLFKQIEGKPEENLIKAATIRSMAKAIYSTKNIGHFSLSFKYYTHFTSPIRRYPDLMVHRILKSHLGGKPLSKAELLHYEKLAIQSSAREVSAMEAERESIKYKQVEYMSEHVGETFTGVISGITEWGIYVEEQESKAEGMIRLSSMRDDFYELDKKHYRLVGEKSKKKYSLGDKVRVTLVDANLKDKTLEWKFA